MVWCLLFVLIGFIFHGLFRSWSANWFALGMCQIMGGCVHCVSQLEKHETFSMAMHCSAEWEMETWFAFQFDKEFCIGTRFRIDLTDTLSDLKSCLVLGSITLAFCNLGSEC